jgi:Na+/alanine symporter
MTVTHNYTKDKFKDGYQFLLSFSSILPIIFIFLKFQSLFLFDIKRNPTQLNNSLKYVVYAMILIFASAPFLYLWSIRDVISHLKW